MAAEVKVFADAIGRLAELLSLASLVSLVLDCRFQHDRLRTLARLHVKNKPEPKPGQKAEEADAPPPPVFPVGAITVALLAVDELLGCWRLFKAPARGKGKSGPFAALLKGIAGGQKAWSSRLGAVENAVAAVGVALESAEAFEAARGLVALLALGVATLAALAHSLPTLPKRGVRPLLQLVAVAVPVAIFVAGNRDALVKACKPLSAGLPLPDLRLALRVTALLAAALPSPPVEEEGAPPRLPGGAPPLFMALQAASLTATLSSEIATGEVTKFVMQLQQQSLTLASFESHAFVVLATATLGLTWVGVAHLQRKLGLLFLAAVFSCVSSPVAIGIGWPKVAPALGFPAGAEGLKHLVSLLLALTSVIIVTSGGSMSMLIAMGLAHLLSQVHGADVFTLANP